MKISEVIRYAGLVEKGNVMEEELAVLWLSELDGMIQSDIMLHSPEEIVSYSSKEDALLLKPPHDKLYVHYLVMMIRQQQQEYEGYQNAQAVVDEKLRTFRRWYVQHYRPAGSLSDNGAVSDPGTWGFAYITAYGLAVQQGYRGTLDEWLQSLKGEAGEAARMRYDQERETVQWGVGEQWYDLFTLRELRDPVVDAIIGQATAAAEAAEGHALAAQTEAQKAQLSMERAGLSAQNANAAAEVAEEAREGAAAERAAAETAAADALGYAEDAEAQAKAAKRSEDNSRANLQDAEVAAQNAEAAAKRAEEAAANAGQGGGGAGLPADLFGGYDRFYRSIARGRVNPEEPLDVATYDGSGQLTHPCVRHFPEGFGGHPWWMAASPYAYSDTALENPCVWYSDDGIRWSADGVTNPLALPPTEGGAVVGYNSDPHLLLREDGVMEVWWRTLYESGGNAGHEVIWRRTSTDGIHWTEPEELYREQGNARLLLCPVALHEDGMYRVWVVRQQEGLRYYESADGTAWRHIRDIDVSNPDYPEYKVWHFDVNHTAKGYEFVGCYNIPGDYTSHKYLYYAVSQDNITYSKRVMILTRGETGSFDERLVYRPTIVRLEDRVRIYYGANNAGNVWSIGLIEAPSAYLFNAVLRSGERLDRIEGEAEELDGRVRALEDGGGDEGTLIVGSFDESPWIPGYWKPEENGSMTVYGDFHHTQLVPLENLVDGGDLAAVSLIASGSWATLRINYFGGNLRWIGADLAVQPNGVQQEPLLVRWPAGAVYVAISANTADKGAITISGVPEGGDSAGADHVIAVETLASGTVTAGTADAFETGVTMGMIRKYRLFLVAIGGVSNRNLNNWYMWIGGKSILRVNVVRGQQILYEFLDNAKTVMLAHSGASGNVGAPAGFLGGSNSYGQFAPGGYACCIYDMADVPDDEPVIIQPNGTDNIDVNWVIMGVTK